MATAAAQRALGVEHALLATLYDARHADGCTLPHVAGRKLESEVAIRVDARGQPLGIAPAIEVVRVNYSRPEDITAANLLLSNLATNLYVVGAFQPWDAARDDLRMTLAHDGTVVNTASMAEAVGGPVAGLPWVWQEVRRRHFTTGDETLLMMGACGAVVATEPGDWVADYGDLGQLRFTIR